MLIIGAKGHALEVLQCLSASEQAEAVFFDDVSPDAPRQLLGAYPVLRTADEAKQYLLGTDSRFLLGLGGPALRRRLAERFKDWGGTLTTVIAKTAVVGPHVTELGSGGNIMHHSLVAPCSHIGEGVLINAGAAVHHDVTVGDYCEISPGARLLGRCQVGSDSQIGALAVILPDVVVGRNVVVGAGAVVIKSVPDNTTVVGVPARPLFTRSH